MGASFSHGTFPGCVRHLVGLPLERVHTRRLAFLKICQEEEDLEDGEGFFMTRSQYAKTFEVKTEASFAQFAVFDPHGRGVITASDVFGAMALLSDSKIDARLRFIANMFDTNKDNRCNASELIMACYSSTRGVAHMKRNIAPPLSILQRLVEGCYAQPGADIDDKQQIRIEDVLAFLQAHELTIPYFAQLLSALGGGNASDLYHIEAKLLKELADLDHHLTVMADKEGKEEHEQYWQERGGDAQYCTLAGIPGLEEVKALQELDARQRAERDKDKGRRLSMVAAEARRVREAEAARAMDEQIRRRVARSQGRKEEEDRQKARNNQGGPEEARCFGRDYHRSEDVSKQGGAGELSMVEMQMAHKWDSLPQTTYGSICLDMDLVLDLVEATGSSMSDQQAQGAVDTCKKDQLKATSFEDFLEWWRSVNRAKEKPKERWRERVEAFHVGCHAVVGAVEDVKATVMGRLQRIQEENDHEASLKAEEEKDPPPVHEEGKGQPMKGGEKKEEEGKSRGKPGRVVTPLPPGKVTISLGVGHFKETRATVVLEVLSTAVPTGRSRTTTGQGNRMLYRPDALALEVLGEEYEERIKHVPRSQLQEVKTLGTVLWFDLVLKQGVVQAQADKLAEQIMGAFNKVPHDYSNSIATVCRARLLTVASKPPKDILRVEFMADKDFLTEVEDQLPFDLPVSSAIKSATLKCELGVDLVDLLTLTRQYEGYEKKCYGPQEEELGEKEMNPFVFNKRVRERREMAMKAAEAAKSMDLLMLKQHLVERGLNTTGTWGEMRERARQAFLRQADHIGFGELSAFGDTLTRQIFKRYDGDKDSALNFREMTSLWRDLRQPPLRNEEEYAAAARDSECGINDHGDLTVEGLVAYYERYGTLVEDAARLGIGSLDDFLTGTISLTADVVPEAVAQLEALFEANRWLQWRDKVAAFMARFIRDLYLDFEVGRLSELFPPDAIPAAVSQPAWLALKVRELQMKLADGWVGSVPELRRAVREHFGEGAELSGDIDYQQLATADVVGPGTIRPKAHGAGGDEEDVKPVEAPCLCPVGTLTALQELHRQIDLLRVALSRGNLGVNARKEYEQQLQGATKEAEDKTRDLEQSVMASLAHVVRSYDGIRELVEDVSYVGMGNSRLTARMRFVNFSWLHVLPAGRGELHPHTARVKKKEARVQARKKMAMEMYETWKARRQCAAAATSSTDVATAVSTAGAPAPAAVGRGSFGGSGPAIRRGSLDARKQDPFYVEKGVFLKGLAAKERGGDNEVDRLLVQEMWGQLVKLRTKRCKDTDGEAVAINNLGLLEWEYAGDDLNRQEQAINLVQKAVDIMQVYSFYLTNAIVREDPVVHQLVKEQVAAESTGAIPPAAAPLGIPSQTAMGYVVMLGNLLYMLDNQSHQPDDVENQGRLALQERLMGIYKNSCSEADREKLADSSVNIDIQGVRVLSLTEDRPPFEYIAESPEEEAHDVATVTVQPLIAEEERTRRKKCLGVTDLEVMATLDPKKAARMRARQARREALVARKEEVLRRRRERQQQLEDSAFQVDFGGNSSRGRWGTGGPAAKPLVDKMLKATQQATEITKNFLLTHAFVTKSTGVAVDETKTQTWKSDSVGN